MSLSKEVKLEYVDKSSIGYRLVLKDDGMIVIDQCFDSTCDISCRYDAAIASIKEKMQRAINRYRRCAELMSDPVIASGANIISDGLNLCAEL